MDYGKTDTSDMGKVLGFLKEETAGIMDYEKCMAATEDEELKEIYLVIIADEKKHAELLVNYAQKKIKAGMPVKK